MRVIPPSDFTSMPWKNGGGVTHEIARRDEGGAMVWRLSIAEVGADGPFSAFPGLARILTVIEGDGLVLSMPAGDLKALPLVPVRFPGDVPVDCRLIGGKVRDFNLIFDPTRMAGAVKAGTVGGHEGPFAAVLALTAGVIAGGQDVPVGGVALDAPDAELGAGAKALLVTLEAI